MNSGYLLNNVLPFRLGEVGKAYLIARGQPISATQALSSVVVERLIDLVMIVVMFGAFLPVVAGVPWAREAAWVSVGVGVGGLAGLMVVAHWPAPFLAAGNWLLRRLKFGPRWEERLAAFLTGLALLRQPRRALLAAFWSGLAWVTAGWSAWFTLLAFVPTSSITMAYFVLLILGLGIAVPSAPGNMGVYEFTVVLALSVFGIEKSVALSFGLLFHFLNFGSTTVLGALALVQEGESLVHLAQTAQNLLKPATP